MIKFSDYIRVIAASVLGIIRFKRWAVYLLLGYFITYPLFEFIEYYYYLNFYNRPEFLNSPIGYILSRMFIAFVPYILVGVYLFNLRGNWKKFN